MNRPELPKRLAVMAHDQGGTFTTAAALEAGLDRYELSRMLAVGVVHRIRRGAYVLQSVWSAADDDARHVLTARAVLRGLGTPAVLSHNTAVIASGLRHHGLTGDDVHVTHEPGAGSSRREAGVTHHLASLPGRDQRVAEGLAMTTDARTTLDVARCQSEAAALVVADHALARGTTRQQLQQALFATSDQPGSRRAGRVVSMADGRSESVGETIGRLALHGIGLAPNELQVSVLTDLGSFRADYGWPGWRLLGEFDGRIKHGRLLRPGESASDILIKERQRELAIERAGWIVVRFTWADVHDHALLRTRMQEAIARARWLGLAS